MTANATGRGFCCPLLAISTLAVSVRPAADGAIDAVRLHRCDDHRAPRVVSTALMRTSAANAFIESGGHVAVDMPDCLVANGLLLRSRGGGGTDRACSLNASRHGRCSPCTARCRSRRGHQDRVGAAQSPVLPFELRDPFRVAPGGSGPVTGVDLRTLAPGAQSLGVDAELLGDPLDRPGRGGRIPVGLTAIRVARSRSSSGYFVELRPVCDAVRPQKPCGSGVTHSRQVRPGSGTSFAAPMVAPARVNMRWSTRPPRMSSPIQARGSLNRLLNVIGSAWIASCPVSR